MPTKNLNELAEKIEDLEKRLEDALKDGRVKFSYELKDGRAVFAEDVVKLQKKQAKNLFLFIKDAPLKMLLSAPIIYAILLPVLLLDLFVTLYQWVCFPIYKIERVKRSEYIIFDRHRLKYLNLAEKINCMYCSYINGFIAFISEIGGRTEQFFCPIKHAKALKGHHGHYKNFLDYGDYKDYKVELEHLRYLLKSKKREGEIKD